MRWCIKLSLNRLPVFLRNFRDNILAEGNIAKVIVIYEAIYSGVRSRRYK